MNIHEFKASLVLLSFKHQHSLSNAVIRFCNDQYDLSIYIYPHTSIIEVYNSNCYYSFNSYSKVLEFITSIINNREN